MTEKVFMVREGTNKEVAMKKLFNMVCVAVIALVGTSVHGATTPEEMAAKMGLGMNVGWVRNAAKMRKYSRYEVEQWAAKGLGHVRMRVDPVNGPIEGIWDHLDQCIRDVLSNGMVAVVCYQPFDWLDKPTAENLATWVDWWETFAIRYQDYPDDLIINLMKENKGPSSSDDGSLLNEAYELLVSTIRQTNPTRIIILEPQRRGDPYRFNRLAYPSQGNGFIMGEWHEGYAAGPSRDAKPKLWTTGTPEERALLSNRIAAAQAWSASSGVPTWEGALMPGNYNDGDVYSIEEQVEFITFACTSLNAAGMPCALNAGGRFWDPDLQDWTGRLPVLEAAIACYTQVPQNQSPVFQADPVVLPDAYEGVAYSHSIATQAVDPDDDVLTYSLVSGPAWLSLGGDGALSGTPTRVDVGSNVWTVAVSDGAEVDTATMNMTVVRVGTPPRFEPILLADALSGSAYSVSLRSFVTEPDGDALLFFASGLPTWLSLSADGVLSGVPAESDVGLHEFTLEVEDPDGADTVIVSLNVHGLLRADAGADQVVYAGADGLATVTLDGSASVGNIGLYRWKEGAVVLGDGMIIDVPLAIGDHTVQLKVRSAGRVKYDSVVITVLPDPGVPPVFQQSLIQAPEAVEGASYSGSISGMASDADGDLLTYSKVNGPNWLAVADDGSLSGSPSSLDLGLNRFVVEVSDGRGGTDQAVLALEVVAAVAERSVIASDNFNDGLAGWTLVSALHTVDPLLVHRGAGAMQINRGGTGAQSFDTTGFSEIEIRVALRTDGFDAGDRLKVQWHDGKGWTTQDRFVSRADQAYDEMVYVLPVAAANNPQFRLRFRSGSDASAEKAYVDSFQLSGIK